MTVLLSPEELTLESVVASGHLLFLP